MNERGFMLLSAIFLTLIAAIMATILLNGNAKIQQRNSTLYYTAINLANKQFALLESGSDEVIPIEESYNGLKETAEPIRLKTSYTNSGNEYTVKVEWTVNGKTETLISTKTIKATQR